MAIKEMGETHSVHSNVNLHQPESGEPKVIVEHLKDGLTETIHEKLKECCAVKEVNPLVFVSREQLIQDVEDFASEADMIDLLPILTKGALVAKTPELFQDVEGLSSDEVEILKTEVTHRWKLSKGLYFTVILNCISAAIQGWDQTGANGANLSFPQAFGIADSGAECEAAGNCGSNSWLIGFINCCPYAAIAIIAVWASDPLNTLFGRRGTIFFAAIFSLLAPIGSAVAQDWPQLAVCRLLLGIGMGLKEVTVPRFSTEIAPTSVRGGLTMTWQIWNCMGGVFGSAANLILYRIGPISWRLQFGSAFIPAVPLLLGIWFCPESPRWYMKKGRYRDAYKSLLRLRNGPIQAARDLYYIHVQMKQEEFLIRESEWTKADNMLTRFTELWTIPRVRRATQAASILMIAQQMSGINIMGFYSATVFTQAGSSVRDSLLVSWGFNMVAGAFTAPSLWMIDRLGRRTLLLSTFPNMFWTLLAAGFCFYIPITSEAHLGLIAFFVFLFTAFYSLGEGCCAFAYSAEVFPITHAEVGMSWAVATNNFWATALSLTFPRMLTVMGPTGAFGFYAGLNIIAMIFIFLACPETKMRSLEELDMVFSIRSRTYAKWQVSKVLPWWIKRRILFQDVGP
ncbi:hypothetical protein A1O3_09289 [Capronia epimyces CBS 606.96]|uniref:Major facilitator superfamily (MFS) profile domain-containing protein n=1 Tax=Capronia epimyces CBS 606.96 TaxID=1182542 RepID=W9XD37_9EURO|nr:uncharacterized protein A1O3_09289 [Capronia epimyces CBS 606.96]EXJ78128.1 hypothetical protein A1O3_09289 [Capronia epimyces CBS 606.96]